MSQLRLLVIILLCLGQAACVSRSIKSTSVPAINAPSGVAAEEELLDVGIPIFDPGLENYDEGEQVYPEVRKAEARYMPGLLADAMQQSGAWGAIRVLPDATQIADVKVQGKILSSDGARLQLQITATDARGVVWLDKKYTGETSRYAYKMTTRSQNDAFQALYNTIANDLLTQLEKLRPRERRDVRLVSELLFARSFSPDAFQGYLKQDRRGRYQVVRLPAKGDPMLSRVRSIRQRDHEFIDTLQDYYTGFGQKMHDPYQEWRKQSYEEVVALEELKAESTRRLLAGGVAILAGIAAAGGGDSGTTRTAGNVAIIGGGYLLKSGLDKRNEAQIHVEALEELGSSLEAEITPHVIELEDRSVTLSGNVEQQYNQWREILADIYRTEVGDLPTPANNTP